MSIHITINDAENDERKHEQMEQAQKNIPPDLNPKVGCTLGNNVVIVVVVVDVGVVYVGVVFVDLQKHTHTHTHTRTQ